MSDVELIPSLKLTLSNLKTDGWNTIVSFWDGLFSGAMLVSGSVSKVASGFFTRVVFYPKNPEFPLGC